MKSLGQRAAARAFRLAALASAAFSIVSSPSPALSAPANANPTIEAAARKGAAVYLLPDCPTEASAAAESGLIALAASFAADFLVGAVENWLAKRKAELSGEFVAGTSAPLLFTPPSGASSPKLSFGCVVIASGEFGALRSKAASSRGALTAGKIDAMGLVDYPDFYLEAKAEAVGDAVTLRPIYLDYRKLAAAERSSKGSKKIVAIIGFTAKSLAQDAKINEENTFAVYRFNFGELQVGKVYKGAEIFTGLSAVQKMPPPYVEGKFQPKAANVLALVAETEDASLALQLLTSAFASNKDTLNKVVEDAVKKALGEEEEKKS